MTSRQFKKVKSKTNSEKTRHLENTIYDSKSFCLKMARGGSRWKVRWWMVRGGSRCVNVALMLLMSVYVCMFCWKL